jgi:hypothetical protein
MKNVQPFILWSLKNLRIVTFILHLFRSPNWKEKKQTVVTFENFFNLCNHNFRISNCTLV